MTSRNEKHRRHTRNERIKRKIEAGKAMSLEAAMELLERMRFDTSRNSFTDEQAEAMFVAGIAFVLVGPHEGRGGGMTAEQYARFKRLSDRLRS